MRKHIFLFGILVFQFWACKKQEAPFSAIPEITFEKISPSTVIAFRDSITFDFKYKDGDGDLGENNANAVNLFLIDNRINLVYKFRIKQLAPDDKAITIQGSLSVILKNTSLTDGSLKQSTTFSIYVIDRAGNKSNTITTSPIEITKE